MIDTEADFVALAQPVAARTAPVHAEPYHELPLVAQIRVTAAEAWHPVVHAAFAPPGAPILRRYDHPVSAEAFVDAVGELPVPDHPEHHYRYDPQKSLAYAATTLAWAGDPAAEEFAREVVAELDASGGGVARPRRAASARLDLALALLAAGKPDEAAAAAIGSGRVVPSNWWRATELVTGVQASGIREAADLRDVYEVRRPTGGTA